MPDPDPAPQPRWGIGEAMIGFAAGLLISALTAGVAEYVTGYRPKSNSAIPIAVTAANVAGLWIGLIGAVLYASRYRGTGNLAQDFGWRMGAWWDLPVGAAVGLPAQYVLIPLLYLPFEKVDKTISHQLGRPAQSYTADAHTSGAVVVLLLVLAVGAPLVEELFFRGLLLRSLLARTRPAVAIGLSAILFALAHFEAVQFAGLALFGVLLAVLAWRTGRLAPSIGAHVAFNAAAVVTVTHLR